MKVKVLSILLPVVLVAGTANAAEIYNKGGNKLDLFGKVNALHYFSNEKSISNSDRTHVHIGFKGKTQINDRITGYGQWEHQVQSNALTKTNPSAHVAFAGMKFGEAGSFDYGRNYGVVYDVTSWTDVLPGFGNGTYVSDNFMQQRGNGFVTYRNNDFFGLIDGLNFAIQYQSKNENASRGGEISNNREILKQNGVGVGGSLTCDLGEGFVIGGAVSNSKRTNAQNHMILGVGNHAATYTSGLKYDTNKVYLAAQYTQTYNATRTGDLGWANKACNFEVVARYQFDSGLRPSVAYLQSKGKNLDVNYGDQDLLKYVDVGATYYFDKNMSTYIDYKINLLNENNFTRLVGITTDDIISVGLDYHF